LQYAALLHPPQYCIVGVPAWWQQSHARTIFSSFTTSLALLTSDASPCSEFFASRNFFDASKLSIARDITESLKTHEVVKLDADHFAKVRNDLIGTFDDELR
jgi:hypothetical protein